MLKIAVQKSGRLHDDSVKLLRECGMRINNGSKQLKTVAENFPLEILFLRDDDIPQYVFDKVADVGIVGENVFLETAKEIDLVHRLGFGKCRLSLAIPANTAYQGLQDFHGKKVATSYPNITQQFFKEEGIVAELHTISGSVEIAPGIGLADAICDLVSSGSTLFTNNLREVETILHSEAVMVAGSDISQEKDAILQKLISRITAVNTAKNKKYILLNAPNRQLENIARVLPGNKSPTIVPLAEPGWSSVQSVVNENDFWEVIEQLKQYEAQGILVVPIEKMIM